MKKLIVLALFFGCFNLTFAQTQPNVGDELTIKAPSAQTYSHIDFPKLNTLVKRGSLANYKSVYDNTVVIDEVITNTDGTVDVILKRKDGTKFFGFLTKVKANYAKAIEAKEMVTTP